MLRSRPEFKISRELDIAPSVIRNWSRHSKAGATTAVAANEEVVPISQLREAYGKVRELERALGRKTMEIKILRAAQGIVKKIRRCAEGPRGDGPADDGDRRGPGLAKAHGLLRGARARRRPLSAGRRGAVLQQIRAVTNSRAMYGYRRVWATVNRTFRVGYNRKPIRRVMKLHGLLLPPRVHRRHGRPHLGRVQQAASNQRWCSDIFLIPCWSGEVISVAVALDCHDREVPAYVASPRPLRGADNRLLMDRMLSARFGEATLKAPHAVQWLSDNGPQYTATASVLYAHELGLVPITTPAYSPQSNDLAEAFVGTFKRDYVDGAAGRGVGAEAARRVDRGLQHPGAARGAGDAEPGGLPSGAAHAKLLAVSSKMGWIARA
jgi:transposase InsO family protein